MPMHAMANASTSRAALANPSSAAATMLTPPIAT